MAGHFDWDYEVKDGTNQQQTKVDEAPIGQRVVRDNLYISAEYRQRLEQLEDDERRFRDKYIGNWPAQDRIPTPGDDEC